MLIATPDPRPFPWSMPSPNRCGWDRGWSATGIFCRGARSGGRWRRWRYAPRSSERYRVGNVRLVATEACRRARNGTLSWRWRRGETGLRLEVIRPEEEARLAVISCAPLVAPGPRGLVFDIGGGSTELVWLDLSEIAPEHRAQAIVNLQMSGEPAGRRRRGSSTSSRCRSGWRRCTTLCRRRRRQRALRADVLVLRGADRRRSSRILETLSAADAEGFQMIGTSGTVTTVGAAHLGLKRYDRRKVDGMRLTSRAIEEVIARFLRARAGGAARRHRPRARPLGADHVGVAILQTLLRIGQRSSMRVADRGLREGMLFAMMSARGAFAEGVKLE